MGIRRRPSWAPSPRPGQWYNEGSVGPGGCWAGPLGGELCPAPPDGPSPPSPPRWLSYLLLFILDLAICLIACVGLAKRSRCLLAL